MRAQISTMQIWRKYLFCVVFADRFVLTLVSLLDLKWPSQQKEQLNPRQKVYSW